MTAVFGHGRLRLYLLKLLAEGPKHGYELIRLLKDRFHGRYAPSAGTIYPRLQRMAAEGLVAHTAAGGRKIYGITDAGREELRRRAGELATLESEIRESVADLAAPAAEAHRESMPPSPSGYSPSAGVRAADSGRRRTGSLAADEFDRRLTEFVVEARTLVRGGRLDDTRLRLALRALDDALAALRRLPG